MSLPLKRLVALPAAAFVAVGMSVAGATTAAAEGGALECVEAGNVWVHVEYEDVVTGACATEFATVTEAMVNTGLAADQGSFYTTVDEVTSEDPQWWSLWTAPVEDGSLGEWTFAQVGAAELVPDAGSVVGWRLLEDWNEPEEAPQQDPFGESGEAMTSPSAEASESEATAEATEAESTASAEASEAEVTTTAIETTEAETEESGLPTGTIVGIGAVVVVAAVGGIIWWRRRGQ